MKLRCISNTGRNLPEEYIDPRVGIVRETEFRLSVGKEYVVYALALRGAQVWYYVADDADLWFPVHHPAPLFEVVDGRLSKHWRYAFTPGHGDHLALFAFEEWISGEYFYDRLTDRVDREVAIFQRVKESDGRGGRRQPVGCASVSGPVVVSVGRQWWRRVEGVA